jgi:hypothetical protein
VASAPVTAGKATATARLGAGTHSLVAVFTPDDPTYAGSSSAPVSVEVTASGSTTKITLSSNSGRYGSEVSATVTVTGQTALPTGAVEIREGETVLATGDLVAGEGTTATVTIPLPRDLPSGSHTLTAVYTGSADVQTSKSQRTYRVIAVVPSIEIDTPAWTVPTGAAPTVTVTVAGPEGAPAATGKVTLLVGLSTVRSAEVVDGVATFSLPAQRWTTTLTALYTGDRGYTPTLTIGVLRVR